MTNARSTVEAAAAQLRARALSAEPGALLGSEETLLAELGVSRSTMRQASRVLEREGLLRVRRGASGGYFGARPDLGTLEAAVSAYLETLDMDPHDVPVVASALWVEVLRKAANQRSEAARTLAETLRRRVLALPADVGVEDVIRLEQESRAAIFDLVKARYIELIFQINTTFAQRRFETRAPRDAAAAARFVEAWRDAKLMELAAIADGDPELGVMAARHIRNVWDQWMWPGGGL